MRTVKGTVKLPACWKTLVDMEFPEDLTGITSEKHLQGLADPDPHYDDVREVSRAFEDGTKFIIGLYSGQSNYYGGMVISWGNQGDEIYNEVWESFCDDTKIVVKEGPTRDWEPITFDLHIEWEA